VSESQFPEQPSQPPPSGAEPPPPSTPPPPPPTSSYGTPPPPTYGGQQPYGTPSASFGGRPLAEWPKRALGYLIDSIAPFIAVAIVGTIFGVISDVLGTLIFVLGYLAALGWALYNAYLAGQTGQSYGMQQVGIRVLRESDGQVIGGGLGIARYFVHIVDSLACYIGWLFPLWDAKKQTFADKILGTIVIDESA
jgi:uncharacterized RDD family membrane protein YckC